MTQPILSLQNVSQVYSSRKASGWGWSRVRAVDAVSLMVHEGETLAIVGESGSGKSTMAKLLLMLNTPTSGEVSFRGISLEKLTREQKSGYRRQVQAVFQDPASSLNPRMTVEQSLGYVVRRHALADDASHRAFIMKHLASVGLTPPDQYLARFPHQLSGGQQQRIAIARAMMLEPKIIIADEPLSSLDVSIQAQVLQLMQDLKARTNVGFVVISHDLGAMQSIANRTAVMYRGRIVEIGTNIYEHCAHPYTQLLLDARLHPDPRRGRIRGMAKKPVSVTPMAEDLAGCRFKQRCPYAIEICGTSEPALKPVGHDGTLAACHRAKELFGAMTGEPQMHVGRGG